MDFLGLYSQHTVSGNLKINHDNSIVFKSRGLDQEV